MWNLIVSIPDLCTLAYFNGPKGQEMHNIYSFYKTIVDFCFGRHGVLLNSALNHIDNSSASINTRTHFMTFTVQ